VSYLARGAAGERWRPAAASPPPPPPRHGARAHDALTPLATPQTAAPGARAPAHVHAAAKAGAAKACGAEAGAAPRAAAPCDAACGQASQQWRGDAAGCSGVELEGGALGIRAGLDSGSRGA
jgi:hypothetical protein